MVWWIQVLEIADDKGQKTGKYRLTAKSDEAGGGPHGLCDHEHDSVESAQNCQTAKKEAESY